MRVLCLCLGMVLLIALEIPQAKAQVNSSVLNGVVLDATGSVVPQAGVTATAVATGFLRSVKTNEVGVYSIPDLPPGIYDVSAEASGFKKAIITGVRLFVGQAATQEIRLELGAVAESVVVTGEAPLLSETKSHVGTVIEGKLLTDIPLNGRNFLQLNLLSPGVTRSKNSNTFDAVQIDPTAASFNVNGQKGDYNLYLLDGATIKEYQHGSNTFSPSVDAVQEFQVTTSNYSAAFGSEAGAQVNLVTKSGTNSVHGVVYEFLRNNKFDANNFFSLTHGAPPFKRNQFGGNLGGPIWLPKVYNGKDRTFFFVSSEAFREVKNIPQQGNYPTPSQLGGNLSTLLGSQLFIDPFSGQPFPNGVIPESRIPSTLQPFLRNGIGKGPWIPAPNSSVPGFNFFRDDARRVDVNQVIVRIDQKLSDKMLLYGRYALNDTDRRDPNLNPNWNVNQQNRGQSASGHLTRTITPNLLADVTFGYSRFIQSVSPSTAFQNDISNQILKIKGLATIPDSWGSPVWSVTGFSNLGEVHYGPRLWQLEIYEWHPAFTLNKGKHTINFGTEFKRHLDNFDEIFRTNGIWNFDGRFTNYALGDFLIGLPSNVNTSPDGFLPLMRYTSIAPYVQEDWKVTSNLTLNLGVRYEWTGVPFSSNRSISDLYFPPGYASPKLVVSEGAGPIIYHGVQQTLFNGIPFVTASSVGLPGPLAFNDNNNIAPRFGFAYKIPRLSSTVVRGGYGIFYQRDIVDKWVEASVNPPFVRSNNTVLDSTNFRGFDWFDPAKGAAAASAQIFANGSNYTAAMMQSWNFTVERTVARTLISAAYVGNKVQHLASIAQPNQPRPGPGAFQPRRLFPDWGTLFVAGYNGNSTYHSGQFKVQRPFSRGFTMLLGYTWSKAIDDTGGTFVGEADRGNAFQNNFDFKSEKGPAGQDIRHRFVLSYVYELPFGKGKPLLNRGGAANLLFGGWQINGITTFQSGSPFTVTQSFNGANVDGGQRRPDLIGNANGLSHSRPRGQQVAQFFDTTAFRENRPADVVNGPFRFGNAGRHIVIGPGINNWDFAAYKAFPFTESKQLQFRAEFFNLFNHPIFANPGSTLGTPQFGRLSATSVDPRDIQFALKLYF
ncbi:MAG: TonB-dependent receptor [Acidobacteria bacterium]|nr:TonB-dependent receptor [Acidobacteriota bacterium]